MNPRPILITLCGAIVFVALCYFGGKRVFEQGHIKDTSPTTVAKPKGQVDNTPIAQKEKRRCLGNFGQKRSYVPLVCF